MGKGLAIANIVLSCGAFVGYCFAGDIRHSIYWLAAAILTASVTF